MITKTKNVYYCEYCKKHGLNSHMMKYHESICMSNPINIRRCFGCDNLLKKQIEIYIDNPYGSEERIVDLFYCNKRQHFLYTPQNKIRKNIFELGDDFNEEMPIECEFFENKLPLFVDSDRWTDDISKVTCKRCKRNAIT